MDEVHERLSLETVESHSLLVCEHVLRYEFAARFAHGAKVLDLACGSGYGSRLLAATAASVTGVDVDVGSIEAATYGVSGLETSASKQLMPSPTCGNWNPTRST